MKHTINRRSLPVAAMLASLALSAVVVARPVGAQAARPHSNVTLTMWTWKVFHKAGWDAVAASFKARTGITVNVQAFSPDALYKTKVASAAQAHQLPDVISYWSTSQWSLAADKYLVDLTGKVDPGVYAPGTYDATSIVTAQDKKSWAADPTSKNLTALPVGHVYTVPALAGSPNFMFFNKSMMRQAGLNPDKAPVTFEGLIADLQKMHGAGLPGFAAGVKNHDVPLFWILNPAYVQAVGRQVYEDQMNGLQPLNNPKWVHMLDLFKQFRTYQLWVPGVANIDIDPADVTFAQGRSSLDVGGTYTYAALIGLGVKASNILIFNVPGPKGSVEGFRNGLFSLIEEGITRDSTHQAEALQWLKFSTGPEGAAIFAKTANDLPAAKLPAQASVVGPAIARLEGFFSPRGTFTGIVHQFPLGPNTNPAYTLAEDQIQQLISGQGASTGDMASALQKEIDSVIAQTYHGGKPARVIVPAL